MVDPSGRADPTPLGGHPRAAAVAISRDGRWVAAGTGGGVGRAVMVWDVASGGRAWSLPPDVDVGNANVGFSPDGRWLATGTPRAYRLWEVDSWRPGLVLDRERAGGSIGPLAFTSDGATLAIGRSARTIELVDVRTGSEILSLSCPDRRPVTDLRFSPDDGLLAAGCMGHVVQVWDLRHLRRELAAMGLDWQSPPSPGR